jgi:hypothetical protein
MRPAFFPSPSGPMPNTPDTIEAMLCPDDGVGNKWTLEFMTHDGVYLYTLQRIPKRTFVQHFDELACQWKKGDPDIYEEMMKICVKCDAQVDKANA